MSSDWKAKAKNEYLRGGISYRKLAEKYGVTRSVIEKLAKKENWVELRRQVAVKTEAKTVDKISEAKADRAARMETIADGLMDRLEQALIELDRQMVKAKNTTKVIKYDNDRRPDKPTKEVVSEKEELIEVPALIDRKGVRDIAAALKDIREVLHIRSDDERREERARIANLERQAEKEDKPQETVTVTFSGQAEEWAG